MVAVRATHVCAAVVDHEFRARGTMPHLRSHYRPQIAYASLARGTTTNGASAGRMQLTPPGNFKLAYDVRRKAPGLYPSNDLNIPDTVQRLHWEPARAQELGLPTSYDYGGLRETWRCHLVTDSMGDDGWLWKMDCEHRRFNFT